VKFDHGRTERRLSRRVPTLPTTSTPSAGTAPASRRSTGSLPHTDAATREGPGCSSRRCDRRRPGTRHSRRRRPAARALDSGGERSDPKTLSGKATALPASILGFRVGFLAEVEPFRAPLGQGSDPSPVPRLKTSSAGKRSRSQSSPRVARNAAVAGPKYEARRNRERRARTRAAREYRSVAQRLLCQPLAEGDGVPALRL
jgi:hypothetical protein